MVGMSKGWAERLLRVALRDGWQYATLVELGCGENGRMRYGVNLAAGTVMTSFRDYAACPFVPEEPAGAFGYWPGEDARPLSRAQREGFA